jgi:hypothetical protein
MSEDHSTRNNNEQTAIITSDPIEESAATPINDYFREQNGTRFAGLHLIVDLWGAERLDDL